MSKTLGLEFRVTDEDECLVIFGSNLGMLIIGLPDKTFEFFQWLRYVFVKGAVIFLFVVSFWIHSW